MRGTKGAKKSAAALPASTGQSSTTADTKTDSRPFKCGEPNCGASYTTKAHLKRHSVTHLADPALAKQFGCTICDKTFSENYMVGQHMRTHSQEKPFTCSLCPFRTKLRTNLTTHVRLTHSDHRPFKCTYCGFCGKTQHSLNLHLRVHPSSENSRIEKRHFCPHKNCLYKFHSLGDLNRHIRTHTGEKPYVCQFCDFKTALAATLRSHLTAVHDGNDGGDQVGNDKKFKCSMCDYKSVSNGNLFRHIRSRHTGEKPFACKFPGCTYTAVGPTGVAVHMKGHAPEKQFKCPTAGCIFATAWISNLRAHQKSRHGDGKNLECDQCPYVSKMERNLRRHRKTVHGL